MMDTSTNLSNEDLDCASSTHKNVTIYDFTNGQYEGIPFNLLINVVGWLLLIFLFAVLRKIAWDYGRIALVSRAEEKWTSLFYGDHDKGAQGSQESLDARLHSQDKNPCSWIPAFFRVKDKDILQKSGRDALQYLSFQRYLLIYTAIITVLSVAIIIPVNFSGSNIGNVTDFGHTTIGNLDPDSPLLWIHSLLAVIFLVILVILMRHFSLNLDFPEDEQVSRTLMISNIPQQRCFKNQISQYFQEAYPEAVVSDVQFAYNISKLVILDQKRKVAEEAKLLSELEFDKGGERPTMRPYFCGQCCCCCDSCGVTKVDAIDYYATEEEKWSKDCDTEKVTAYQDPLGIAFVTFQTDYMAAKVRTDFRASCKGSYNPQTSSLFHSLNVEDWNVRYAPSPENIYWENLSKSGIIWWIKATFINLCLVLLLFFFTTPVITISMLNQIKQIDTIKSHVENLFPIVSPILVEFLPTIMLWTFAALLPNLVYYSDHFIGHWTRTSEHHAVMVKSFIFLLLMVLILPSLGLTSAKALFQWFVMDSQNVMRWKCIFVAGNGAFFVNYVITSALIGTALEMMRFSELFMYAVKLSCAHSSAERTAVKKSLMWEFQFGIQYAWMLCVFSVIMAYSLLCPLVAPFGLLYMVMKHLVDRYNIYFAYKPSRINKHIHGTAINFVVIAVILLQFNIVFFTAVRSDFVLESVNPVFVFSSVALFISLVAFVGRACFGWFKNLSSLTSRYRHFVDKDDASTPPETTTKPFVATVLMERTETVENGTPKVPSSYGALASTSGSVNPEVDGPYSESQ